MFERASLIAFALFLRWLSISRAAACTDQIVRVLDGDTIEVLHNQHPERIRLSGIDCPEKGQAYDKRARQVASDFDFGKEVTLQTYGHDKYKRTIADVFLPDWMNLNQELVRQGWYWKGWRRWHERRGKACWADPLPVPPWEWRRRQPRGGVSTGGVAHGKRHGPANIGGGIGVGDAMASCRSTRGLPISSEENF